MKSHCDNHCIYLTAQNPFILHVEEIFRNLVTRIHTKIGVFFDHNKTYLIKRKGENSPTTLGSNTNHIENYQWAKTNHHSNSSISSGQPTRKLWQAETSFSLKYQNSDFAPTTIYSVAIFIYILNSETGKLFS